jgi:prepilin-type N-terminal cleavage/methylation domain-containing protein
MKTKKGFSFLELLIVMMIISILFVTFKSSFQIKNKDILYGQACIEHVYGEVNNFVYAAISSKSVYS